MEIIIKGEPNEIAALVLAAQEQRTAEAYDSIIMIREIVKKLSSDDGKHILLM